MKKLFNRIRRSNKVEAVYVERSHRMNGAELISTGFTSAYVRF